MGINTPDGNMLILAKLANGKDYFTGDFYYDDPMDGRKRPLRDPDSVNSPFYNFNTIYNPYNQNLIRMFLDLDNNLHFMTSTGGAYLNDRNYGVGMILGDINNDNKTDFFISSASLPDEPDFVSLYEIEDNKLQLRWKSEQQDDSIYVLAMGDIVGNGRKELIVFREKSAGSKVITTIQIFSN